MRNRSRQIAVFVLFFADYSGSAANDCLRIRAEKTLHRAVEFFRHEVSANGGYLWRYSADLEKREGEGKATATQAWVQPPGTPSVGFAFLDAFAATGDDYFLQAATETGLALVQSQFLSGGWNYRIEFDPAERSKYAYRVDDPAPNGWNLTTLDDNTTQEALGFLMNLDRTLDFSNEKIHEAALYCLEKLIEVQYPNGAWPQRFASPPDPDEFPVKPASYPESWSRTHPGQDYKGFYTFNDNAIGDTVRVMLDAADIYGDPRYQDSAEKAGDFILLAQMPEPQPAWAQQYDADMRPAWARRFEPPAITGGESQGVMETLLTLYEATGKKKYLEPLPHAIEYFRGSRLPDGRLARFYELQTNKPLYFTKDYQLTYSDSDMPTHYGFKSAYRIDAIAERYEKLLTTDPEDLERRSAKSSPRLSRKLVRETCRAIASLDERGRWVETGRLKESGDEDPTRRIIETRTFINNVRVLSRYLEATRTP